MSIISVIQKSKWTPLVFSAIITFAVLWSLLLPGYVLTLDMIFTPDIPYPKTSVEGFANNMAPKWIMYLLGLIVSGWIVQKIILIGLFILLPLLTYQFLLPPHSSKTARIWAALFYTINPFIYTRFLAGHYMHLFAYALLPWIFHQAQSVRFEMQEWRKILIFAASLALALACSLHIGLMAVFIATATIIALNRPRSLRALCILLGGLLVATSYWTLPYLFNKNGSILGQFTDSHWEAFNTVGQAPLGVTGSVLALYGFWGETQAWAEQFIWPQNIPWLFVLSGLCLLTIILSGIFITIRKPNPLRRTSLLLLCLMCVAFIFSCGVGESPFRAINQWMFEHIGFWKGFRDSQKWSALLAFGYAWFGGISLSSKPPLSIKRGLGEFSALLCVLLFTWPMLFGFWGQLKPIWYPESWTLANEELKKDPYCKTIFLPWHSYLSFDFTNNILIANPAKNFFDCEVITSKRVEFGNVLYQGSIDANYYAIEGIVTGIDPWTPEEAVDIFQSMNIRTVLSSHDLVNENDEWSYNFLQNNTFFPPTHFGDKHRLTLYNIRK